MPSKAFSLGRMLLLALLLTLAASTAHAETRCVDTDEDSSTCLCDPTVTWNYSSIQSAIDSASNGDTILICGGTYQRKC